MIDGKVNHGPLGEVNNLKTRGRRPLDELLKPGSQHASMLRRDLVRSLSQGQHYAAYSTEVPGAKLFTLSSSTQD